MMGAKTYHLKNTRLISAGSFDVSETDTEGHDVTVSHKFMEFDATSKTGYVTRHFFDLVNDELYTSCHDKVGQSFDVEYSSPAVGEPAVLTSATGVLPPKAERQQSGVENA